MAEEVFDHPVKVQNVAKLYGKKFASSFYSAEDFYQDACVAMLIRGQWPRAAMIDSIRRWVGRVDAHHTLRNIKKVSLNHHKKDLIELHTPEFFCYQNERGTKIRMAVQGLPRRHRTVISLYFFDHKNQYEIGRRLGVCPSRVSQVIRDGLIMLEKSLAVWYKANG